MLGEEASQTSETAFAGLWNDNNADDAIYWLLTMTPPPQHTHRTKQREYLSRMFNPLGRLSESLPIQK